jgi:hypothetical protein
MPDHDFRLNIKDVAPMTIGIPGCRGRGRAVGACGRRSVFCYVASTVKSLIFDSFDLKIII